MENRAGQEQQAGQRAAAQRQVRLRQATIRADGSAVRRTAQFTDGSTRAVEMQWGEVRRVAAFRRDVLTKPVFCVAISDPRNVVVLDESMEGWDGLVKELSRHVSEAASFSQWRESIEAGSQDSYWTALFTAVG